MALCAGDPGSTEGASVLCLRWEVEIWWRGGAWLCISCT